MNENRRISERYDVAFYVPWAGPLLTDADVTPTGGAETQTLLIARVLARRGLNVGLVVFALNGNKLPRSVDGVGVVVRPPYRAHARLGRLREVVNIFRVILAADADVIVTRAAGPHVGFVGLAAKLLGRRFIYSSANMSDFDFGRLSPNRRNLELFRLGIRLADEIVVQTAEQASVCRERFGRSPVVITSIAEPAPERSRDPEAFLWIGRLVWYKRPFAFVELARSVPQAKFWMVAVPVAYTEGGAELKNKLEQQAATVPNLEIVAPRARPALMDLIDRAVAVVNTADFEGMPNIFLEGWARGVPALALTHDPDNVIERHHLGAFAHGSEAKLAALARELWDERGTQSDVTAKCREYVSEHHAPERVGARWEEVLIPK